jgi:hypothetical protein
MATSRSEGGHERGGGPNLAPYRHLPASQAMDLRSDDSALGTLGWILVIVLVLMFFGVLGFTLNT